MNKIFIHFFYHTNVTIWIQFYFQNSQIKYALVFNALLCNKISTKKSISMSSLLQNMCPQFVNFVICNRRPVPASRASFGKLKIAVLKFDIIRKNNSPNDQFFFRLSYQMQLIEIFFDLKIFNFNKGKYSFNCEKML